jgi:hypothetical protein
MIANDHAVIEEVFSGEYGLKDALEMLNQCVYRGALTSWDKMIFSNQVVDADEFVCQFSTRFSKFTINGKVIECPEQENG